MFLYKVVAKKFITRFLVLLIGFAIGIFYKSLEDFLSSDYSAFRIHDDTKHCELIDVSLSFPDKVVKPLSSNIDWQEVIKVHTGLRHPVFYNVEVRFKNCDTILSDDFEIHRDWVFDVYLYDENIVHEPRG